MGSAGPPGPTGRIPAAAAGSHRTAPHHRGAACMCVLTTLREAMYKIPYDRLYMILYKHWYVRCCSFPVDMPLGGSLLRR